MNDNLNTSVTELLVIFRGAMLAIIPWLEKAKIKWRDDEAYDDWDNIAESLYQNIVVSSLIGEVISEHNIAKYNFIYDNYALINHIKITVNNMPEKAYVFVALQSINSPFDCVKASVLDHDYKVIDTAILNMDGLEFIFVKNDNGTRIYIDKLSVEL
jgi:hypothetical protein